MSLVPLKKSMLFLFISGSLLIFGIVAVIGVGSHAVLVPKRRPLEERHLLVNANPREYGIALEGIEARSHDGHLLKGYLVRPEGSPGEASRTRRMWARLDEAGVVRNGTIRGTVILMHGRGGLKENMLTIAQRFVAADLRCIVYDARAHGASEGLFCTYGKRERRDVSSLLDHVEGMLKVRGESLGPVVAFGNSLGAATMLQAIPEEPRIVAGVAAAPFADMREEVIYSIGRISRLIPVFLRSWIVDAACFRGGFRSNEVAPEDSARKIAVPVFVAHGRLDKVIPIEQARRIYQNLPRESRKWREIPDAYHYNILASGGDDLYEAMIHFYLEAILP